MTTSKWIHREITALQVPGPIIVENENKQNATKMCENPKKTDPICTL